MFTLLEGYTFDETGENMTVVLSPEAEALFRAWLRRHKIWREVELTCTPPRDRDSDAVAQRIRLGIVEGEGRPTSFVGRLYGHLAC